jgi:HAD superfamily hydrolase (TIGR01509 family)
MKQIIQAVLWDLDGVLVDTAEPHYISWVETLKEYGFSFTHEHFDHIFGMHNESIMPYLLGEEKARELGGEISEKKEIAFRAAIRGKVVLFPGVMDWLRALKAGGIACAVASSAPMPNIDAIIDETEIRSLFGAVVSGLGHPSKPEPWVFLEAARQLQMAPENCLVIEDSIPGVQAAKAAGMTCLGMQTTNPADVMLQTGADYTLNRLSDCSYAELMKRAG